MCKIKAKTNNPIRSSNWRESLNQYLEQPMTRTHDVWDRGGDSVIIGGLRPIQAKEWGSLMWIMWTMKMSWEEEALCLKESSELWTYQAGGAQQSETAICRNFY